MKAGLVRATACSVGLMLLPATGYLATVSAQTAGGPMAAPVQFAQQVNQAPIYAPQQLDQLLAPIALYPDPLLAQILMAATYPLEDVEAARWVQDPRNAALRGDQLDAALQQQDWDPSVKSLVPFPQILQMLNSKLDWTQALGNAFLAQQADVMDSVQRLRAEAAAAGTLRSTPQEAVTTEGQTIVILPANPQTVYVPYYNPAAVYGTWEYPDYPPVYFPPPPNYAYAAGPGIYFGIGFGIVGGLWGWGDWDWGHHDIHIDRDRYNRINDYAIVHDNRPRYTENTWQHDPAHRRGVPYSNPDIRQKFQRASAGSADVRRNFRGFDNRAAAPGTVNPAPNQVGPGQRGAAAVGERRTNQPGPNFGANRAAAPAAAPRPVDTGRPGGGQQAAGQQVTGQQPGGRQGAPPGAQRAGETARVGQGGPPAGPAPQANARIVAPPPVQQRAPVAAVVAPPPVQRAPVAAVVAPPPVRRAPVAAAVAPPQPAVQRPAVQRPAAPAFSSFGRGPDVRAQSQRGQASRQSIAPAAAPPPPRAAAPQQRSAPPPPPQQQQQHRGAPSGGGQKGGVNDKQRN
jgi:hypothetical protein